MDLNPTPSQNGPKPCTLLPTPSPLHPADKPRDEFSMLAVHSPLAPRKLVVTGVRPALNVSAMIRRRAKPEPSNLSAIVFLLTKPEACPGRVLDAGDQLTGQAARGANAFAKAIARPLAPPHARHRPGPSEPQSSVNL